jgi:hypothetical protein
MNFDYDFYNLVLSEITARIASDQIVIEKEANNLLASKNSKKFNQIIARNRVNILLLSEFVFIGRQFADSPVGTNNLLDAIKIAEIAFAGSKVTLVKNRTKPLIDVIGDKKIVSSLIKIAIALIVLEDTKIKKLPVSIRRRGDFATVKISGGEIINHDLFLKDSALLAMNLFSYYGAKLKFTNIKDKRVAFLRLHLSNQMPLLYNK